jgi:hypothetical protein
MSLTSFEKYSFNDLLVHQTGHQSPEANQPSSVTRYVAWFARSEVTLRSNLYETSVADKVVGPTFTYPGDNVLKGRFLDSIGQPITKVTGRQATRAGVVVRANPITLYQKSKTMTWSVQIPQHS